MAPAKTKPSARTYTISLTNRKPRGSGHERLAEILVAAKELFLEQGVENVTTRKIAQRDGISKPPLLPYYSSEDKIPPRLTPPPLPHARLISPRLSTHTSS